MALAAVRQISAFLEGTEFRLRVTGEQRAHRSSEWSKSSFQVKGRRGSLRGVSAQVIRGAEALRLRGIPAAHCVGLGPDLTYHEERMNISAAVRSRKLRVLYLQAHFLRDHTLISAIGEAQGGLHMLAIDEVMGAAPASISLPAAHSSASI